MSKEVFVFTSSTKKKILILGLVGIVLAAIGIAILAFGVVFGVAGLVACKR